MPGDRRCLPKCLPPEHGACSTRDAVDRCHYRSQPRILSHKLQQVRDQPGICPDTGGYGHRVTNQTSTSFPQSKRDGQSPPRKSMGNHPTKPLSVYRTLHELEYKPYHSFLLSNLSRPADWWKGCCYTFSPIRAVSSIEHPSNCPFLHQRDKCI